MKVMNSRQRKYAIVNLRTNKYSSCKGSTGTLDAIIEILCVVELINYLFFGITTNNRFA